MLIGLRTQQVLIALGGSAAGRTGGLDRFVVFNSHFDGANADVAASEWTGKALTFAGNAALSTTQKKFGATSLTLDGSGDYLTAADSEDWNFGNTDFTIEAWVYPTATTGACVISQWDASNGNSNFEIIVNLDLSQVNTAGAIFCRVGKGDGTFVTAGSNSDVVARNAWSHIALVRKGNVLTCYVNGTATATTGAPTWPLVNSADVLNIGRINFSTQYYFTGYIDEIRVSKGIARYTSNFTTAAVAWNSPTLDDDNTISLLHFDSWDAGAVGIANSTTVLDENGQIWTPNGNAQIDTAQSKFGGSSYLGDGTGDYLLGTGDPRFAFGSGDFTIECFVRLNTTGVVHYICDFRPASTNGLYPTFYVDTDNKLYYYTNSAARISGSTALSANTWYHVAVCRSGTSTKMFLNGTQEGSTYTDSNAYLVGANRPVLFAGISGASFAGSLNGWADEFRVSNFARYTANFTAPSASFGTTYSVNGLKYLFEPNTAELLHFDDAATTVAATLGYFGSTRRPWAFAGNAALTTVQSKFGGSCLVIDGTGDWISTATNFRDFEVAGKDWTVDFWLRFNSVASGTLIDFIDTYTGGGAYCMELYRSAANKLGIYLGVTQGQFDMTSAWSPNANQWYHLEFARSGSNAYIFIDGVSQPLTQTTAFGTQTALGNTVYIGADGLNNRQAVNGWIDEFRFTNGLARHTSDFTPATAAYFD